MAVEAKFRLNALAGSHPTDDDSVHLINLTESGVTPQSIVDLSLSVPIELPLEHGREKGLSRLCHFVAERSGVTPADVLITAGAASAVYFVQTALLSQGDHLVVTRPNYPANIEGPQSTGCEITYVDSNFAQGFCVDVDRVAAAIQPNTKLISTCNPNNPTGTSLSTDQLRALSDVAKSYGCRLLVDETYVELLYESRLPGAATLGPHVIGVSSMSKTYGVSGLRVGWITTTDPQLQDIFLAAKQVINITAGILDESLAEQILAKGDGLRGSTIADLKRRRDMVDAWVQSEAEMLEWIRPVAGATGFVHVKREPPGGMSAFYRRLRTEQLTAVVRGLCFEQSDEFFRLGFGYPPLHKLTTGLEAISKALRG